MLRIPVDFNTVDSFEQDSHALINTRFLLDFGYETLVPQLEVGKRVIMFMDEGDGTELQVEGMLVGTYGNNPETPFWIATTDSTTWKTVNTLHTE